MNRLPRFIPILISLAWFLLVGFQCSVAFGFGYGGLLLLICALLLGGMLVTSGWALRSGKWRLAVRWAGSFILVILSIGVARSINRMQKEEAILNAQPLLAAIERFHQEHRRYPESIAQVVPRLLDAAPRPRFGFGLESYRYSEKDGTFSVAFDLPDWEVCEYDLARRSWHVSD